MKKNKGRIAEEKFIKTINSGAYNHDADAVSDENCLEIKYTEKKGYRITTKTLQKIWNEAFDQCKFPILGIIIEEEKERWILKVDIIKERK